MKKNVTPSLGGVERRDWNLFEVLLVVARVVMVLALWGALVMVGPQAQNIGGWFVALAVAELLFLAFGTWRWAYGQTNVKETLAERIAVELVPVVPLVLVVLVLAQAYLAPIVMWQGLLIIFLVVIWVFAYLTHREFTRQPAERYLLMRAATWSVQALGLFWAVYVVYGAYLTTLTNPLQVVLTITFTLLAGFIVVFGCLGAYLSYADRYEREQEPDFRS